MLKTKRKPGLQAQTQQKQTSPQTISHPAFAAPIPITYSRRKTLAVLVYPDGRVEVRAPMGCPRDRIESFLHEKAGWIARTTARRQRESAEREATAPAGRQYITGEVFPFLGEPHTLQLIAGQQARVRRQDGQLLVTTPTPGDTAAIARLLKTWVEREAARVFRQRLEALTRHAATFGIPEAAALTIRRMKTRWGSCSSKRRITLNLKLITLSPDLLDYVIAHELCHLCEMNHSRRYYALLDQVRPGWREERAQIKRMVAQSSGWP